MRVWALPNPQRVEVVLEGGPGHAPGAAPVVVALEPEGQRVLLRAGRPRQALGTRYRYRLDGEDEAATPTLRQRFDQTGPHRPIPGHRSRHLPVARPGLAWCAPGGAGALLELHLGTFTPDGTWAAASRELPALADLGVTVLGILPFAYFPGRFGWGYDGVNLFAPTRLYGFPDNCRRFIDQAHALGLGVIQDVVYNHPGTGGKGGG